MSRADYVRDVRRWSQAILIPGVVIALAALVGTILNLGGDLVYALAWGLRGACIVLAITLVAWLLAMMGVRHYHRTIHLLTVHGPGPAHQYRDDMRRWRERIRGLAIGAAGLGFAYGAFIVVDETMSHLPLGERFQIVAALAALCGVGALLFLVPIPFVLGWHHRMLGELEPDAPPAAPAPAKRPPRRRRA